MKEIILLLAIISVPFLILRFWGKWVLKSDNRKQGEYDKLYESIKIDIDHFDPDKELETEFKLKILQRLSYDSATKEKTSVLIGRFDIATAKHEQLSMKINDFGWRKFGDNSVNKREFANRSDVTEDDLKFVKGMK